MNKEELKEELANSILREAASEKKEKEPIELSQRLREEEALWFANKMYEENKEDFS